VRSWSVAGGKRGVLHDAEAAVTTILRETRSASAGRILMETKPCLIAKARTALNASRYLITASRCAIADNDLRLRRGSAAITRACDPPPRGPVIATEPSTHAARHSQRDDHAMANTND
jgi:hypothetical protein